ncbi:MAG TPA: S-layer homology domain-containing protein [Candidatus Paenibacillus intestinavium]|nr:S-layer homology domain-containing protein [Candidatus Paenibacillus intestinavium]
MEHPINKSTVPDDSRPHATGTAKILWDNDYLYARVVVEDSNLYQGPGGDHTYDSLEFYVGPGSNASNQWRVSATGIFSGQSHTDRAAWTQLTDTGYIVEMRIPKKELTFEPGNLTFEVYINNSTANGGDRYEVVSAFGNPDTGYGGHTAFADSLELIEADVVDSRFSITTSMDTGGTITPIAPGNVLRVDSGEGVTFTITPDHGKIIDTVTVDGEAVTISNDNTISLLDISADHEIRVTFKDDPSADQLPFIVWNDNFASGEYTTAVIIDLGEGKEVLSSELYPGLFTVSARNTTLVGDSLVFEGTRKISRVYANDEPKVRGYLGKVHNSPDYQDGLTSGRYIVVELEFYTEVGGNKTLDGSSNSTKQNYNIVQNDDIVLTEGAPLNHTVFKQESVINPILDKFTAHTSDSVNYALYLHKNENGEELQGMPLYVYTHGMSRGGTQAQLDQKASMKSANGSVALMKKMEENPTKYASHILNISYNGTSTPQTGDVKKVIDDLVASGLVDSNRIYVAGFSWGGAYTNTLINTYPGFFAAGAPMAPVFGSPEASTNQAHKDLAYWIFVNTHNTGGYQTNLDNFINNNMPEMTNANASRFESNEALTWPYNQFDQPSQRPNPDNTPVMQDYIAHEVEAAVLYNGITMGAWSIAPIAQSPNLPAWDNDYTDVFDWMFSQSKLGVLPDGPTATFGTPELGSNDPLWSKTMEYPINKSTVPDDSRPHATGTVKVLWDTDYVYSRVVVEDSNLYQGLGPDHMYDSLEFYVGPGSSGSNQWRVSATGVLSGQSHTDRAAWTEITDTGYSVEMRIPKRDLILEPGKFTFEVYINNSTENGGDRYEVISAFGNPDTGFGGHAGFANSLELTLANEVDTRFSITTSTDTGGTITPNAPGNVLRVVPGSDKTFTIIPDHGKIVDIVTVDGEAVTFSNDNTFSLTNISADHEIHVTFKDDPAADQLPFIVWNDNFASGEYTTAVIIDVGEGKQALGSELDPDLFTVSAKNTTLVGDSVVFEGTRKISRVYANYEPKVRGYLGKVENSPDYQDGLEGGRYIVVELEFYTEVGGNTTLYSSNSTKQNYNIIQNDDIVLTEGAPLSYVVFDQDHVVNPILDKFTPLTSDSVNYALYLHKDEEGEVLQGMPLYVYTHGFSRGGTQAHIDQKASMKSANGSVALMKKMEQDPDKYASHILNISYSDGSTPQIGDVKKIIDDMVASGLVDPNLIYASGFSMGAMFTNTLINTYPGFFAAAAPLGIASGTPSVSANEAHRDQAYWIFVNTYYTRVNASQLDNFITNDISDLTNARASRFESNEALTWPYNQYDQPSQRPNPDNTPPLLDYIAHEVEAAVLYNEITMEYPFTEETWSIAPIAQSPSLPAWDNDYTDVFDWMFAQRKLDVPSAPSSLKATAGDRKVTLSWTVPADDGGSTILSYKVWYGNETPVTLDAKETKYTFTSLTNGQNYTFKVVAVNAKGDSAEITATATPKKNTPIVPDPSDGNTGNTGNTGNETDAGSSKQTYTVNTPQDKPAVTDTNGNTTLPGGGLITTKGGTKLEVPEGTTIDSNGKVTIPADKSAEVTLPGDNGITLNIHEGTELVFDDDTPLGFIVISGNSFNDVNKGDWFYSYVNSNYTFDLFNGTTSSTFSPGTSMTRAMFVQVLANLENVNRTSDTSSRFSDVTVGQWYTAAVEWAAESGIVNGISADLFDPNASMTREQMLVILHNYMNYKGYEIPQSQAQSFTDESEISSWAMAAVKALQGIDIVTGKGNNLFDPKGTATRAEVATVFVRFIEYLAK